jgi:hypothetical protein
MRSARCALDHLHGQEVRGVGLLEAVDGGDVGVVERRQHPRFALEGRQPFGVGGDVLRQHLDRNVAPELGVARAIHHTHPSRTQGREDLVGPDAIARLKRHVVARLYAGRFTRRRELRIWKRGGAYSASPAAQEPQRLLVDALARTHRDH